MGLVKANALSSTGHHLWSGKSTKFSKSWLPGNQTFSILDAGHTFKNRKKDPKFFFSNGFFFQIFFSRFFFVYLFSLGTFHTKFLTGIDNLYLTGKIFKNIRPDSVRFGRTCLANLGVRSCPVWSYPVQWPMTDQNLFLIF